MKGSDEYEILPANELEHLRHEVEKLKKNPLGDTNSSITLLDSISALNTNIERLTHIFESANSEMVKAYHEKSFQEQLRKLRDENAKIARGIVAVAGLVKDLKENQPADIDTFLEEHDARAPAAPPPPELQIDEHSLTSDLQGAPVAPPPSPPPQNPFMMEEPERSLTGDPIPDNVQIPPQVPLMDDEVPPPPPAK